MNTSSLELVFMMQCSQRTTREPSALQGLPEGLFCCVGVASDAHRGRKTKSVFLLPQSMTYRSFRAPSECILCASTWTAKFIWTAAFIVSSILQIALISIRAIRWQFRPRRSELEQARGLPTILWLAKWMSERYMTN